MDTVNKLKTLKDIDEGECESCAFEYGTHKENKIYGKLVDTNELKKEAIKWILKSRELTSKGEQSCRIGEYSWMDFFNISEDDLK